MMNLPVPSFIDRDPAAVEAAIVAAYEAETGRILYPAQLERLLIHTFAFRESLVRVAFQDAAKQNLLAFAAYPMLDYLGDLVGVARIPAVPAFGRVTITGAGIPDAGVAILPGFRVSPAGGKVVFELVDGVVLTVAAPSASVAVRALVEGAEGNGFLAGSAWEFVDGLLHLATVVAGALTSGGEMEEDDDHLRERIRLAPQAWATGGTKAAYRWHAMSVSTEVIDVTVLSCADDNLIPPGMVKVFLLSEPQLAGTVVGAEQAELLRLKVVAKLAQDDIRALCDTIEVSMVTVVTVVTAVAIKYYSGASVQALVTDAVAGFNRDLQRRIGKDLVAEQVSARCMSVAGVYAATVTFTGGTPVVIGLTQVYRMAPVTFTFIQVADIL
jgi:phage-related baseplate assembly protein